MKTKKDVIRILESGKFYKEEAKKALKYLERFSEDATLAEIAEGFPAKWAYLWAKEIGDKEIMRERITDSEWAYYWTRDIGDRKVMAERITDLYWKAKFEELEKGRADL